LKTSPSRYAIYLRAAPRFSEWIYFTHIFIHADKAAGVLIAIQKSIVYKYRRAPLQISSPTTYQGFHLNFPFLKCLTATRPSRENAIVSILFPSILLLITFSLGCSESSLSGPSSASKKKSEKKSSHDKDDNKDDDRDASSNELEFEASGDEDDSDKNKEGFCSAKSGSANIILVIDNT